tara:strand:+ start:422 stop:553 length:132 start_codon:yes stop_codon:yes gene_type:complete
MGYEIKLIFKKWSRPQRIIYPRAIAKTPLAIHPKAIPSIALKS